MNKKRILLGALVVLLAVGIGVGISQAFFTDTETGTGSEFTVGTLDMDVGGANGTNVEPFTIDNIGSKRNLSGGKTWTVNNTGSLPGRLYFDLANLINHENSCNEPEESSDGTCDGTDTGELGQAIDVTVYLDGEAVTTTTFDSANETAIGTAWDALSPVIIPAGSSKDVKIEWEATADDYGNEVQSDSVAFDMVFNMEQLTETELGYLTATPTP